MRSLQTDGQWAADLACRREELVGELAGQVEDRAGVKV